MTSCSPASPAPPASPVVSASRRHCVVQYDASPTPEKIRQRILRDQAESSGFIVLDVPVPTYDPSHLLVLGNDKTVLVGGCFLDSLVRLSSVHGKSMADEMEIVIDPFDDGLGFVQFIFALSGKKPTVSSGPHRDSEPLSQVVVSTHLPYPEAQVSSFEGVRLLRYRWWDEDICAYPINGLRMRWLFAWFDAREVFRNGRRAGFNLVRNRSYLDEFSSWNHASGNGSQDALSLGKLYQFPAAPARLEDVQANLNSDQLTITGRSVAGGAGKGAGGRSAAGKAAAVQLTLTDPLGEKTELEASWQDGRFAVQVDIAAGRGRFRLSAQAGGVELEPAFTAIDVPQPQQARDFVPSILYDVPDDLISNYTTPQRLESEFALWKQQGMQRVHWIDYSNWPSFWQGADGGKYWGANYDKSIKHCPSLLTAACAAAHAQGLSFIADLKTFDLGFNCWSEEKPFKKSTAYEKLERRWSAVIPEIAAHPEATLAANPQWQATPNLPVTRVVFYSDQPLPVLKGRQIKVLASADNRRFTRIKATVKTGQVQRQHECWTPAGTVAAEGKARNWFLEISGFRSDKPYLAVQINGEPFEFRQRGFMFARAFGADGKACVVTPATSGGPGKGFFFWKGWQGWSNQTEAVIQRRAWASGAIGLAFAEADVMPTLLEPSFEQSRQIWLSRVAMMAAAGVDGVSIRSYCHHNGPMHYLKYAFAQPVRETFQSLYGRAPQLCDQDYTRIRDIRGDFYTQFIGAAHDLLAGQGKKLMVELESGIEVPSHLHVRMQLPMQWQRWISDGLVDEVRVKWFSPWSVFVHEQVLPLARRHGVPVQVISRCMHQGPGHRFEEYARKLTADTVRSGFAGYCWYERQSFMELNAAGRPVFKGPMPEYFTEMRQTLAELAAAQSPAAECVAR